MFHCVNSLAFLYGQLLFEKDAAAVPTAIKPLSALPARAVASANGASFLRNFYPEADRAQGLLNRAKRQGLQTGATGLTTVARAAAPQAIRPIEGLAQMDPSLRSYFASRPSF
jgi:hypothetical protein